MYPDFVDTLYYFPHKENTVTKSQCIVRMSKQSSDLRRQLVKGKIECSIKFYVFVNSLKHHVH